MRVSRLGTAVVVLAIIGTLAIFLLPLPRATAPYPATHGPVTYPRSARMAVIVGLLRLFLIVFAFLGSTFLLSSRYCSSLCVRISDRLGPVHDRISLEGSILRC
jgi:hypothetical protein